MFILQNVKNVCGNDTPETLPENNIIFFLIREGVHILHTYIIQIINKIHIFYNFFQYVLLCVFLIVLLIVLPLEEYTRIAEGDVDTILD